MKKTKKILPVLPMLIHSKYFLSPWGTSTTNYLRACAKKKNLSVKIVHDWQEVSSLEPNSFLIVIGTDTEWLNDVLTHLSSLHLRIILVDGVSNNKQDKISCITFNQTHFVEHSLAVLKNCGRNRTALFGIQKNDSSDMLKADAFSRLVSSTDIYFYTNSINACFDYFFEQIDRYDSIICANDLVAIYLIKRCLECNISIPQQLYLIGNGNLWISSHMIPSLTTWDYDQETMAMMTLQICINLAALPPTTIMDIFIVPSMLERKSTGNVSDSISSKNNPTKAFSRNGQFFSDVNYEQNFELHQISDLNSKLSSLSSENLVLLQKLVNGKSYETISEEMIMPLDTAKSRIKKIYNLLEIHTRHELIALVEKYHLCFDIFV